jgi:hypothetical protein
MELHGVEVLLKSAESISSTEVVLDLEAEVEDGADELLAHPDDTDTTDNP